MKNVKTIEKYFHTPASLEETLAALRDGVVPVERQFVHNKYICFDVDSDASAQVKMIGHWISESIVELAFANKNGRTSAVLRAELSRTRLGGTEIRTETVRNFGFLFFELLFAMSTVAMIIFWIGLNNAINPLPNLRLINDGLLLGTIITGSAGLLTWVLEFGSYVSIHTFIEHLLDKLPAMKASETFGEIG